MGLGCILVGSNDIRDDTDISRKSLAMGSIRGRVSVRSALVNTNGSAKRPSVSLVSSMGSIMVVSERRVTSLVSSVVNGRSSVLTSHSVGRLVLINVGRSITVIKGATGCLLGASSGATGSIGLALGA